MVTALHRRKKTTVIFVSHNMDDIARLARHLLVFNKGMLVADGTPQAVFGQTDVLREAGLRQPHVMTLLRHLREAGLPLERTDVLTAEEAEQAICAALKKMRGEKS